MVDAFWSSVDRSAGPDGCWPWMGIRSRGYGRTARNKLAHREAFALATGQTPGTLLVCHHCDNPSCVNPAHLFLGTAKDNAQDASRKGRLRSDGTYRGHGRPLEDLQEPWRSRQLRDIPLRVVGNNSDAPHDPPVYPRRADMAWLVRVVARGEHHLGAGRPRVVHAAACETIDAQGRTWNRDDDGFWSVAS